MYVCACICNWMCKYFSALLPLCHLRIENVASISSDPHGLCLCHTYTQSNRQPVTRILPSLYKRVSASAIHLQCAILRFVVLVVIYIANCIYVHMPWAKHMLELAIGFLRIAVAHVQSLGNSSSALAFVNAVGANSHNYTHTHTRTPIHSCTVRFLLFGSVIPCYC